MPRAVDHRPLRFAGLDVPNLYTEQMVAQLLMLLKYGEQPADMTGLLILVVVESVKMKMGQCG